MGQTQITPEPETVPPAFPILDARPLSPLLLTRGSQSGSTREGFIGFRVLVPSAVVLLCPA